MKIRDLNLDDYVIVYDIGKSEYSEGMTIVGRVDEIIFNEDYKNEAGIDSLGNLYDITDNNYFDLWSKSIEGKTEHIGSGKNKSVRWIDDNTLQTNLGHKINIPEDMLKDTEFDLDSYVKGIINEMNKNDKSIFKVGLGIEKPSFKYKQSNDVQQRKRNEGDTALFKIKDLKVGYKVKVLGEDMTGEVSEIANNGKSAEIQVDDGVYRVINDNYDFTILEWNAVPQYPDDTVNHPSHYNYGEIEVIDFIEQVTKHYNPNVAYHIGNAIKYLARSPHKNGKEDVDKARWYIERAFENWDVK
ncbi:DUF3310 domain-containing protein [Staphylococcus shinii]|uniref:DUF3310 domain-containing protein n=1 Tax=Staphylococcus shinii TaxID=2912228 RepID=UPI003F57AEF3